MNQVTKKTKFRRGISGIVVALMLVLVGVVAIVGIKTFLDNQSKTVQDATTAQVKAITNSTTSGQ